MTIRFALVRPEDIPPDWPPTRIVGWADIMPGIPYTIVEDRAKFTAWAARVEPSAVCAHGGVDRRWERQVRESFSACGTWVAGSGESSKPEGLRLSRPVPGVLVTRPDGLVWESPLIVAEAS